MSIRADPDDHVKVKGTMISTLRLAPSCFHVTIVHAWGLPNHHGVSIVDGTVLHVSFDRLNHELVHVWAEHEVDSLCLVS